MSLETRHNTRLKGLYRLNRRLLNQIEHEPNGKERQHRIDERAAVAIAIGLFRDHPELVYAKLQAREDSLAAERVRQAEQAAKKLA
jgi:hypothetical protein